MILITTAGKVGAEAARVLAAQGEPVRVIARNPEKVAALSQAGVEVVKGDLEVPASIDAALRDVSSVILVSLAIPNQELVVVTSAVRADVDHVVKITSKASADSPIARRRGRTEIEERFIASGLVTRCCGTNFICRTSSCWRPPSSKPAIAEVPRQHESRTPPTSRPGSRNSPISGPGA